MKVLDLNVSDPKLWDSPDKAKELFSEKSEIESKLNLYNLRLSEYNNLSELFELSENENDVSLMNETENNLNLLYSNLKLDYLSLIMNEKEDSCSAYLEIHSGAGGTEACDWAFMLSRMYIRWAEQHNYKIEIIDEHAGDETGFKSLIIQISGLNVYGWLKYETGVHRLVRISPFDSNKRRHTSFASVAVYPVIDDTIKVDINEKDLKIDTYRASGAGGQHVNKTDSAVRITHIPTGIVVQCQNERSQFKNKDVALGMLKSKLYDLELKKKQEEKDKFNALKTKIDFGTQIRSYVLQPYQLVKDLRTGFENTNVSFVLDGGIDGFLSSVLLSKIK